MIRGCRAMIAALAMATLSLAGCAGHGVGGESSPIEAAPPPPPPPPPPPAPPPPSPYPGASGGSAAPTRAAAEPDYQIVPVFYATTRAWSADSRLAHYANWPGPLSYGRALVSIPNRHVRGAIETAAWYQIDLDARPGVNFTVRAIERMDRDAMLGAADREMTRMRASPLGERSALLFVHGFNVPFRDAVFRAAQIGHDIGFAGASFLYSWPSAANPALYPIDAHRIRLTEPRIAAFIADIFDRTHPARLYIVAHSMGTLGTTRALALLARQRPDLRGRISALILAAPDIDRASFLATIGPALSAMAPNVTAYVSDHDHALELSRLVNHNYRLGDSRGGVPVLPPMVTIDLSSVDSNWLGHSVYGDSPRLLEDIGAIIANRAPATRRWLVPKGGYYLFDARSP